MKGKLKMKRYCTGKLHGTAVFLDIRNFLGISGILENEKICKFVIDVMEPLSYCVIKHSGRVCQIQGDGIMAIFEHNDNPHHAISAVECALDMQAILDKLNPIEMDGIRIPLKARIGVCCGDMYACFLNVQGHKEYLVLGKSVNLASRYQNINKHYNTKILVDESVFSYIKEYIITRKLDNVKIEGCGDNKQLYEILYDRREEEHRHRIKAHYEKGLVNYLQGNLDDAIHWFSMVSEDKASYLMMERCQEMKILQDVKAKEAKKKK
ncbi:MAG: adenylate/guanylate cyclase domain-containing protein [Candidatus Neomarinimicrobiota bacterium]